MKAEIVSRTKNPLLKREELRVKVEAEKTLGRRELLESLSAQLNVKPEYLSIPKIRQEFGSNAMMVEVRLYESPEALQQTELPQIVFRNRGEKRKPQKKEAKKKKG